MIHIGLGPDMINVGFFHVTWHGFFTFLGVATAVALAARWARTRETIDPDLVYAISIWAIMGGIIGARLFHVIDFWGFYMDNPGRIVAVWRGGIALYGGILGGFAGGYLYLIWSVLRIRRLRELGLAVAAGTIGGFIGGLWYAQQKKLDIIGRIADITAPAMLIGQTVGRIGDLINGEHCSDVTGMPWGLVYTNQSSPAGLCQGFIPTFPMHPAIGYEMIWNLAVFGVIWALHGRLRPPGMLFLVYLALYSVGRFAIGFLRLDGNINVVGLTEAHFIALGLLIIAVPWLAAKAQWVRKGYDKPSTHP